MFSSYASLIWNKLFATCNKNITQPLICDYATVCGGVLKVPITKELLSLAAAARWRYRIYLEEEKRNKLTDIATQNQRAAAWMKE